jgi:hypothetical protein
VHVNLLLNLESHVLIVEGGCSFLPEPAPLFRYTFPRCSHITVLQAKDHYARLKRRIIQVERGVCLLTGVLPSSAAAYVFLNVPVRSMYVQDGLH